MANRRTYHIYDTRKVSKIQDGGEFEFLEGPVRVEGVEKRIQAMTTCAYQNYRMYEHIHGAKDIDLTIMAAAISYKVMLENEKLSEVLKEAGEFCGGTGHMTFMIRWYISDEEILNFETIFRADMLTKYDLDVVVVIGG